MKIQDEQVANTTIPEEPLPREAIPPLADYAVESERTTPAWKEYQRGYDQRGNTTRAAIFGGLAGGVFFFGLAVAILSGHFLPVFLLTLALTSLLGSLSSSKAQAIYAGFQGFVFFVGLAACAFTGWWWPGILVVLGIAAILGIGNGLLIPGPVARPGMIADQYYTAIRVGDYAIAYRFLDANLTTSITLEQFIQMARVQDTAYGIVNQHTIAPDLAVTTTPLAGEPLPEVAFEGNPAENLIVTVRREYAPSYIVHLKMRRAGKEWKIAAFDRI